MFTCSGCGPFTKNKERTQIFKEARNWRYIYRNKSDKACFQHDMVYGYFKNLHKSTAVDRIVHDKALTIAKNPDYDGYQRGIHIFWMTHFLIKSGQVVVLLKVKIY